MKKNILGLILAVMVFVPSGSAFASDTSYGGWLGTASTVMGGLPALYALFSKIKELYFGYVHPEINDIHGMMSGFSLLRTWFSKSDTKLSSLVKTPSLDDQFMKAAQQLYERLTDREVSINDA